MNNVYYVYALCNPITRKVFYIGKGKKRRAWQHLTNAKAHNIINSHQYLEIQDILLRNQEPIVKILKSKLPEDDAFKLENLYIKKFKERLTNIASGQKTNNAALVHTQSLIDRVVPFPVWAKLKERTESQVNLYWFVLNGLNSLKMRLCQHQ